MKSERPIVLVDMDGVLADFDGATETFLRDSHPHIPIMERKNFYFRDDYPDPEHEAIISKLHSSQGFFLNLPPIKGALEGLDKVEELGYEARICSSPLSKNLWCVQEKREWLRVHRGRLMAERAIIDSSKENYDGIALVDDRPVVQNADIASWSHVVFDQPYNRHVDADLRIQGWDDPNLEYVLTECLARYRRRSAT
ncbi:hypothetical protein B7Y94_03655 [Candidatus Saccharibacteria bacterium 32-49-12]|nr:MAG: hypothetical protein B7Y94_03655 [Candidatus Saccharibacteria bacterium 32-49-12]